MMQYNTKLNPPQHVASAIGSLLAPTLGLLLLTPGLLVMPPADSTDMSPND